MPDILLYLGGQSDDELRYALRSWCKNLQFDKLCVVGGPLPRWLKPDVYIPNQKRFATMRQCYDNLLKATESREVGEDLIVLMDDVFVMKPSGSWPINFNRHTLAWQFAQSQQKQLGNTTEYNKLVLNTQKYLEKLGYPDPLSFEEHAPFRCNKSKLRTTLLSYGAKNSTTLLWRSIYGNTQHLETEHKLDIKVTEKSAFWPKDALVLSTNENSFSGRVGVMLMDRFSAKCKYE